MIWLPVFLCLMAFWGVLWIESSRGNHERRMRLWTVVLMLLIPLLSIKYSGFLYNEVIAPVVGWSQSDLKLIMPLGISFMTFTIISYVVDVYQKRFPASRSFFHVLAYVLFFPHLIAGPIQRPHQLIPQLLRSYSPRLSSFGFGLTLITVGLVKKAIFSDSIGEVVDPVFDNPEGHDILTYWMAMLGYTVQIYCDFSGYTDMALGSARILGIRLPLNFNMPYTACSLRDFWRRWHITLSRWLMDYVYIFMGGSRCSRHKHLRNILVTMVVCGIWHGANWTFLAWGLFHGFGLMVISSIKFSPTAIGITARIPYQLKWLLTFGFIVISWVLFRASDLSTAKTILMGAFAGGVVYSEHFFATNAFPLVLIGIFALLHKIDSLSNIRFAYQKMNKAVLGVFIIMAWAISIAFSLEGSNEFIYFDF